MSNEWLYICSLIHSFALGLQLSKLQDDIKALESLTKTKEAALLDAEREVQFANIKAALVDDLLNKKQELTKQNDMCQVIDLFLFFFL